MKNLTRPTRSSFLLFCLCFLSLQAVRGQYAVTSVPYSPYPFSAGTSISEIDDIFSGAIPLPFSFCFYDSTYTNIEIGSNGNLSFDSTMVAGTYDQWDLSPGTPIPTSTIPTNGIYACYRDIDPALPGTVSINYTVYGTAPNRQFVVTWDSIPDYDCTTLFSTFQAVLYEGSNVIDVYIQHSTLCAVWNGGFGIVGIQNSAGTSGVAAPGRNNGVQWAATTEAWRFTPTSSACALFGAGPDLSACQSATATTLGGGIGTWSAAPGNPSATVIALPASPVTDITGLDSAGVYSFIYTGVSSADTMTVTVSSRPYAGPDQLVCRYGTVLMGATGSGFWSALASNPGVTVIDSTSSPTTPVSGFSAQGDYIFVWSNGGCSDSVNIMAGSGGPNQVSCANSPVTMAAAGTGVWFPFVGSPAATHIVSPTSPTTEITGFSLPGAYGFVWIGSSCTDTVYIVVNPQPDAGADQTVCIGGNVFMAASGVGTWSALSPNAAGTNIYSPNDTATEIDGFTAAGTYVYEWTNNGCADTANVYVTSPPNAGTDQTICQYSTAIMTATGTGTWSAVVYNPVVTNIASPTSPTTTISGFDTAGYYSFTWGTGGCTSQVNITVNPKPDAGADQSICQSTSTLMAAAGTGFWTEAASNPASAIIASPGAANSVVYGFTASGTYAFYWSDSTCQDTMDIAVVNCADSVWPGDADANHLVDNNDLLPIGLGYSATGPVRPVANIVWQPDFATDWTNTFVFGVNYKHADCNGDGTIDDNDTLAITQNFGIVHYKNNRSAPWRSGIPALTAVASRDTVFDSNILTVTFNLGDASMPLSTIYGLAFTYNFDPLVIDPAYTGIDFGNTWFGNGTNKISIREISGASGQIKTAVTGIDHLNRSGSGAIGTATFKITTANLTLGSGSYYLNMGYISDVKAVDASGGLIDLNEGADTTIITLGVPTGINGTGGTGIRISPNPAHDLVTITSGDIIEDITMYDVAGKEILHTSPSGIKSADVNVSAFAEGLYFVHVATARGAETVKLTIVR